MVDRIDPRDPRLQKLLAEDRIGNLAMANELRDAGPGELEVMVDRAEGPRAILTYGWWARIYARDTAALSRIEPHVPRVTGESGSEAAFAGTAAWVCDRLGATREVTWETPCWLYFMEDAAAATVSSPPGLPLGELSVEHAALVNENWDLGEGDSEDYIRRRIEAGPSAAMFIDGRPVSWSLTHGDGQMGIMYTLPECRRMGYGRAVTERLIERLARSGQTPFLYIKHENQRAQQMARALGFERWGDYRWFGLKAP
jgi:ribosomal protein S18 acetylase RimI-like enzyme